MIPPPRKRIIALAILVVLRWYCIANAQSKRWQVIKSRPLVQFDWNCALPSAYPKFKLNGVVRRALQQTNSGVASWADRAFAFDLNADGKAEYFVPLSCGATGNCSWGVFETEPVRWLGTINGQYIYVHKRTHRWPEVITYAHMNSAEGLLTTHHFRRRHYVPRQGGYHTDVSGRNGGQLPRFIKQARQACEHLGY